MHKTVLYLAACVTIIALLGLNTAPNGPYRFFLPNGPLAFVCLAMAVVLPFIMILQHYRRRHYLGIFLELLGGDLLVLAVIGLIGSPTYFGLLHSYAVLANLFVLFLVGLTYLIGGLEVPAEPLGIMRSFAHLWQRARPGYSVHMVATKAIAAMHVAIDWYYAHRGASVPNFQK